MKASPKIRFVDVHGHRRAFVTAGQGPALLLLHGVACDHTTWDRVIRPLARDHTVIAPDLLGHGRSAKPHADYSLGGYANGMRDLLSLLQIERATVVGHSFGGGVAMQFAYQFPELTERLVLIAPGGIGPEVSPIIRMATMPGFQELMSLLTLPGIRHVNRTGLQLAHAARLPGTRDVDEIAAIYDSLRHPEARAAVQQLLRGVVDRRGQFVTMADRAYLTASLPLAVIWGAQDPIIPSSQARTVQELAPAARVEIVDDSGHFPHRDHPREVLRIIRDFLASTQPAAYDPMRLGELLRRGQQTGHAQPERSLHAVTG
ncbi:putative hydrolase [Flexivirga endophytica]|uniref:Hydrolase n=1 Tax=Flexivirga endophytica TaxID=1849103 RepID=A0A916T9R1_9MICO|nr:alpha/beta fold hydrolase [Flexivirga endophytica]GGB37189.1 putative hydrolase [Flexivirga endophytica]GHB44771.1 putative hydrolase [Flexivirga endophytica]